MTPDQYATFPRNSGRMAATAVTRYAARPSVNPDHPTERDIRAIREILANCRRITKSRLARQWRGDRSEAHPP